MAQLEALERRGHPSLQVAQRRVHRQEARMRPSRLTGASHNDGFMREARLLDRSEGSQPIADHMSVSLQGLQRPLRDGRLLPVRHHVQPCVDRRFTALSSWTRNLQARRSRRSPSPALQNSQESMAIEFDSESSDHWQSPRITSVHAGSGRFAGPTP